MKTRNLIPSAVVVSLTLFACGGHQQPLESSEVEVQDPEHDEAEATLERCQSLTEVLLAAPGSGNGDLMLTVHYAYEDVYLNCLEALDTLVPPGEEHTLNTLAYGVMHLQSTRIGVEALYGMEEEERTCDLLALGIVQSDQFFEDINNIDPPTDIVVAERVLQLRMMGLDTAQFFEAAYQQVFDGACPTVPMAP